MRLRKCAKRNCSHKKRRLNRSRKPSKSLSRQNSRNTRMSKLIGSRSTRVRKSISNSTQLAMWLFRRSKSQENSGNTINRMIESILERFRISMSTSHWFKLILPLLRTRFWSAYCNKMLKNKSKNQLVRERERHLFRFKHFWHFNLLVYTTDALLLALMTSKKSEFPFDILVEKEGNSIILDKYEEERMNYMDF